MFSSEQAEMRLHHDMSTSLLSINEILSITFFLNLVIGFVFD